MKKLKEKWGIDSNFQVIIILIVFAITGSISVIIADPVVNLIGINKEIISPWIFWPLRIFIIFPIYQVLIVIIGAMFGQFNFFWTLEKKMLSRLGFKKFRENI